MGSSAREKDRVVCLLQVPKRGRDMENSGDFTILGLVTLLDIEEEVRKNGERGQPWRRPFVCE